MQLLRSLALLLSAIAPAAAQNPTFDVVSVKPLPSSAGQKVIAPVCVNGNYQSRVVGVAGSIRFGYHLEAWQLAGLPEWSTKPDAGYDIEAKSAGPVGESECRLMVQALLADRFHLAVHRETRTMALLNVTLAKGGAKIQPWKESDPGLPVEINGVRAYDSEHGWTMAQFAEFARRAFPGTPVIDRTGLAGSYRIKLEFQPGRPPAADPAGDFELAVERQMGLKFESRKEPVEVVVIDHLDRPTAN